MPVYIPYYILYYSYSTAPLYYTDYVLNTLPTHTYTTTPYRPIPTFATSVPRNATLVFKMPFIRRVQTNWVAMVSVPSRALPIGS